MNKLTVSASPHITKKGSATRNIMLDVIIALMPALIAATFFFGYHVIINTIVCIIACVGCELLFGLITRKKFDKEGVKKSSIWDLSAIVTAIILALNLPAKAQIKAWDFNIYKRGFKLSSTNSIDKIVLSGDIILLCIIGSIVAIALVKMLFGGIGKNFANPAVTARIFLFAAFGLFATQTIGMGFTATTGATWLSGSKATNNIKLLDMFIGNKGAAAVGETSVVAILLGFIYLSVRKIIDFRMPLIIIGTVAVFSVLLNIKELKTASRFTNFLFANVLSGGLIFGAVYMATDYSSSPNTFIGQVIFAVGIGLFTVIMREFTKMPEGVSFAILLMNIATPLIDKLVVPKSFGYIKEPKKKAGTVKEPQKMKLDKNNNTEKKNPEVSA